MVADVDRDVVRRVAEAADGRFVGRLGNRAHDIAIDIGHHLIDRNGQPTSSYRRTSRQQRGELCVHFASTSASVMRSVRNTIVWNAR
ncbi:conserved 13E12 repeat family protein [Mycobacterium ulcerans str. Harvey]|uniref:Conserved 13E12 repeat family protein n=1 Tax=Mycobacterium ulcerans str. Harvey TaxID=1299332 RepID=A0ABN0R976_MYCUL|nr:conserved 13E12 repeat family protein [Mycobacterium ulcerans str. Harvey]